MLYGKRRADFAALRADGQRRVAGAGDGLERAVQPLVQADDRVFPQKRVLKLFAGGVFIAIGKGFAACGNAVAQLERDRVAHRNDHIAVAREVRGQQNFIGFFRHAPGENAHGNEIGKAVAHRFNQQIRLVFIAAADIRPADRAPGRELIDFAVRFKRIQLGIRKGRIEAVERADRRDLVAR